MQLFKNNAFNQRFSRTQRASLAGVASVFAVVSIAIPIVTAATNQQIQDLQNQINQVQGDSNQKKEAQGVLGIEASSLNDAITKLQDQINASQSRINQLDGEVVSIKQQITDAEAELARQRDVLGQSIKAMYLEGDITTVEMLATSKDLSDYFDKQQYRESVQDNIKTTLDTINQLKADLTIKRSTVEASLAEQQTLRNQLAGQRAEKDRILALNKDQQNQLESQIKANSGKLAELKKKQADAEAALARSLSSGSYKAASAGPVAAGDAIGNVGSTGLSSGPHLHLEVRTSSGALVNPSPYIKAKPVNMPPGWISQSYGEANPLYASGYHRGTDYASSANAPIFAIDNGQMYRGCSNDMLKTRNNDYGYVAIVEHSNGTKSVYAHMSGGPPACNFNTYY